MNNKVLPVFALEGAAFAGKTTLLKYLNKHYSNQVITIPEASEYVGGDHHFPDVPFKTYEDAKSSTYYFIELEKRRCKDALALQKESSQPVIMDRTTPLSSLIFYSLLSHADPSNKKFIESFYQHALEAFQIQLEKGNIFIPGGLIYIKPKSRDVFESRLGRGTKNGVFSSWDSYKFLDDKYNKLINMNYKKNNVLVIESDNSEENLQEISKIVIDFISTAKPVCLTNVFKEFLGDDRRFVLNVSKNEDTDYSTIMSHVNELMDKAKVL